MMAAAPSTTSATCSNCLASGVELRQIMPMLRAGGGESNREMETRAERVSTGTAISGMSVTPMPAPTICTSVDSELPSMISRDRISRGRFDPMPQKDSA